MDRRETVLLLQRGEDEQASMAATQEAMGLLALELPDAPYAKLSPGPGKNAAEVAAHQRTRIHGAMIEIVAEEGYRTVTVRDLSRRASVSSRAFYKHFQGKEDCFLQTHELVVRRAAKRVIAAQAGERDWEERLRLAFRAFARGLAGDPQAARLALIEVHAAGAPARAQSLWAEGIFAAMISESFGRAPEPGAVPPLLARGLVAGIASVARSQLLWGDGQNAEELGDELARWVLCCRDGATGDLAGTAPPGLPGISSSAVEFERHPSVGERELILSATAKLTASEGYGVATLTRIRCAAGITRKTLEEHFDGLEECVVAATESAAADTFAGAARAKASAPSWEEGIFRAMATLCEQIANDPVLAKLCFVEVMCLGSEGLHCCERSMAEIGDLICSESPSGQSPDDVATEASVGAIWGMIKQLVLCGREQQLPQLAPTLASLALAPSRQRLPVPGLG
jgi:AcrR family transcriptional regulator